MGKITLRQAAAWCGGTVEEKYADVTFLGANNDTRVLKPGQLFVVLQGARDGHDFIANAMEKGAAAVLCTRKVGDYPAIFVEDPRIALGQIAAQERLRLGMKVVGVTGSVGKSTTKEMIAGVLATTFRTAKTPANHNNDIGMPMAILAMPEDTEVAVVEMGMNHFREMAYLSQIAKPDYAAIINIGTAHMEYLGSVEGICQAKLEILEGMEKDALLFLNGDDVMLRNLEKQPSQPITYFGSDEGCAVRLENVIQSPTWLRFRVHAGENAFPVEMQLDGNHFVLDAMAAVSIGLALGVSVEKIQSALASFHSLAGRQEIFEAKGMTIIKDCYNAGPESMEAALTVLGNKAGRRVAVLGDMLELGHCTQAEHYRVGRIAAEKANLVFAYGPNAERVISGCATGGMTREKAYAFSDQDKLIAALKRMTRPGDVILFKASRGIHLENVLDALIKEEDN